jgi:hypothetical protein
VSANLLTTLRTSSVQSMQRYGDGVSSTDAVSLTNISETQFLVSKVLGWQIARRIAPQSACLSQKVKEQYGHKDNVTFVDYSGYIHDATVRKQIGITNLSQLVQGDHMLTERGDDAWVESVRTSVNTGMPSRISNMPPAHKNICETWNFYKYRCGQRIYPKYVKQK